MDYICQELNIPRKQIKETGVKNRFKCIVHKSFLKTLVKCKKISGIRLYPSPLDEWPKLTELGSNWELIYLVVRQKVIFVNFHTHIKILFRHTKSQIIK